MVVNVRPHISRIDKSFKEDLTRNYNLTIQLALDGFSFVVYSADKQRFIALEHYFFDQVSDVIQLCSILDEIVLKKQWLAYAYQSVYVLVDNNLNTLVPFPLYDEKEKGHYLAFTQTYVDNSRIAVDKLKNNEAYNVYYLSNVLVAKIKNFWANSKIVHQSSVFIESLLIEHKNKGADAQIFINMRNRIFDMVVIKDEKLLFYNTFKYNVKEDFIYFVLFSMEQLRLNPEKIPLTFIGIVEENSDIFLISEHYIRTINFAERNKNLKYSYLLEEIPFYKHYLLYNTQQCEL